MAILPVPRSSELRFRAEEAVAVIVANMTNELWKILRLLGKEYEDYYS